MARLLSLTDLFLFLSLSLFRYSFHPADDVKGGKKKKCLDVVDSCPSSKGENDEVHMYICMYKTVIERITNTKKED